MKSIRRTLLMWLFAGLSLGLILTALVLYQQARVEANRLFDYQMQQMAASLPDRTFAPMNQARRDADAGHDIVIQIWDDQGVRIYHSHDPAGLPQRAQFGFTNIDGPNGGWRVYSTQLGNTIVQVAQPLSARSEVAADTALRTVAPMLLLFPFLGLLIWFTVTAGLAPVRLVAAEVQTRDVRSLAPIVESGLPAEIRPLTHALNDLLSRLNSAIGAQRAFVADAAHALRTPLTALQLQMQLVERASDGESRRSALADLRRGIERSTHMVKQLLDMARLEPGATEAVHAPLDLAALTRAVASEQQPLAASSGIQLEVSAASALTVRGSSDALHMLIANLLENALRYTPAQGRVQLSVAMDADKPTLTVQDNGPGVPEAELAHLFDRFYRVGNNEVEGSGLGLSIARQIALAHGATIHLENIRPGLRATVRFPAA